jgi:peptidyl-prolyl cis-trans isomerase C
MRQTLATVRGFLTRDPFILFLIVAAAIFLVYWSVTATRAGIEVTSAVQKSLSDDYEMMTGQKPDPAAQKKLIDDYVTNELLFREAVARGMHMSDKTTKQRLIDRVRFMIAGAPDDPNEDTLLGFYASHPHLYRAEPRMSVRHVFFEQAPPADAADILVRLNAGETVKGDEFWMGRDLPDYGISILRGLFGQPFLDAIGTAPVGKWIGPIRSVRGWHVVQVSDRGDARMLPYPEARGQVLQDYNAKQTGAVIQREIARLKEDVDVEIE